MIAVILKNLTLYLGKIDDFLQDNIFYVLQFWSKENVKERGYLFLSSPYDISKDKISYQPILLCIIPSYVFSPLR